VATGQKHVATGKFSVANEIIHLVSIKKEPDFCLFVVLNDKIVQA
jgi:hypothetical protein